jgi:hypothetical protein
MIALAALTAGPLACAQRQDVGSGTSTQSTGQTTFDIAGYRLDVTLDDKGSPTRAQAYDGAGRAVPTKLFPLGGLSVCVPEPVDVPEAPKPYCQPLSSMNERATFRTGTQTQCYFFLGGQFIVWQC